MKKRILSLLLSLIMVLSLLPTTAWADWPWDGGSEDGTGNLKITKTVVGTTTDDAFTITVKLQDGRFYNASPVSGTFGDYIFTDGTASISLKHNESVTIPGIPAGTYYTVKEADNSNYTATYSRNTGSITKDSTSEVTVTNTWTVTTKDIDHVDIGKDDGATTVAVPSTATVTVTYADGSTRTLTRTGTSTGNDGADQWRFKYLKNGSYIGNGNKSNDSTGAKRVVSVYVSYVVDGQTYEYTLSDYDGFLAGVDNCPGHSGLDIGVLGSAKHDYYYYKVVYEYYTNDTKDATDETGAVQQVTATSVTLTPDATRSYGGNSYTFDSTKSDSYTNVSLTASKNSPTNPIVIKLVYVRTTTPPTGNLTITKTVENVPNGLLNGKTFTFEVKDADGNKACDDIVLVNDERDTVTLPVGNYTVTETSKATIDGYTLQSTTYNKGTTGNVQVTADGAIVAVINTYTKNTSTTTNYAELTVTKTGVTKDGAYVNGTRDNSVLAGAEFTLTKAGKTVAIKTTDANGVAVFDNLDEGTYKLKETGVPAGYTAAEEQQITVVKTKTMDDQLDGNEYKTVYTCTIDGQANKAIEVKNTQNTTNITVEKKWENATGITLPDSIKVELYKNNAPTSNYLTLTPGTDGKWTGTFTDLPTHENGQPITYTVKEDGYTVMEDGKPVNKALDGFTATVGTANNGYTITNTAQWDEDIVNPASLTIKKLEGTTPLNGVKFKLVSTTTGVTYSEEKATTGEGIATFDNLLPGTYTLTESQALTGYQKVNTEWTVMVEKNTAYTRILTPDENENNQYQKVYDCNIKVYKDEVSDNTLVSTPNNCLTVQNNKDYGDNKSEPATLYIYKVDQDGNAINNPTNAVFKLTKTGQEPLTSTYDTTKRAYVITGIQADGDWTLTEEAAPTGYDKDTQSKTITVKKTTSTTPELEGDKYYYTDTYSIEDNATVGVKDNGITIKNAQQTTEIAPTKAWVNADGITLPVSITVELYKNGTATGRCVVLTPPSEGNVWTSEEKFTDLPTHENGKLITYTVKEVGYTVMEDGEPVYNEKALDGFTATVGNANNGYTITNTADWGGEIVNGTLTITKVDSEDSTKLLADAYFQLLNADGNIVASGKTDDDGMLTLNVSSPIVGMAYQLYEETEPDGYKSVTTPWTVKFTKNETPVEEGVLKEDGKFHNVYDCKVTVTDSNGNELEVGDNVVKIVNEAIPEKLTYELAIQKTVKKTGGNVTPSAEEFLFSAYYLDEDGTTSTTVGTTTIKTDGESDYTGTLKLTVPASAFDLNANGNGTVKLFVSEVKGSAAGWTYDDNVYTLTMTVENYKVTGITSGEVEIIPNGDAVPDSQLPEIAPTVETLTFTNEFSQTKTPNRPNKPSKPITSVKTGDAGVAMYAMSGLLSLGGAALFVKKRKDEE